VNLFDNDTLKSESAAQAEQSVESAQPSSIFLCSSNLLLRSACSIFISTADMIFRGTPDTSSNLLRSCHVVPDLSPHDLTPNQNDAAKLTLNGKTSLPKHSAIARVALCTTKLPLSPNLSHQFTKTHSDLKFLDLFNLPPENLAGILVTQLVSTPFLVFSKRVVSVVEMQAEDKVLEQDEEQEMESNSLFSGEQERQVTRRRDGAVPENEPPVRELQAEQITRRR
jgi:hypothetical protein